MNSFRAGELAFRKIAHRHALSLNAWADLLWIDTQVSSRKPRRILPAVRFVSLISIIFLLRYSGSMMYGLS